MVRSGPGTAGPRFWQRGVAAVLVLLVLGVFGVVGCGGVDLGGGVDKSMKRGTASQPTHTRSRR